MNYEIKRAVSDSDIKQIAECAFTTWHFAYDELLPSGQVDYMIEKYQSFTAIKSGIENDGYIYYIAFYDNKVIGFIGIKPESEKLFISKIYVLPDFQRQGIATRMFHTVLEKYKDKYNKFYLTVNKNNARAISTYNALGFIKVDSIVTDIGDGYVMDDYVMEYTVA